jgi:hypothetical protein
MDKEEFHWVFGVCPAGLVFSKTWVKNQSKIQAGNTISGATNSHRDISNRNQPLLFFHMVSTNSIVWTRKSFIGSLVSCRVDFQQNLGQKSVMDSSCQHNFLGHQQPRGHHKQEPTTFILSLGSNKQHCMDKEEFHWVFGVLWGWFLAKLGSKISQIFKLAIESFR